MKISDIDLRLLRVFQTVASSGGIVKAQVPLGISQPTISLHIANLEKRLNVVLCHRGPKGFSLTPEGQLVLEETERLQQHLDNYTARLAEIGNNTRRRLRIGAIECLLSDQNCPLQPAIRDTMVEMSGLDIILGNYEYLDIISELRSHRIDIGLIGFGETIPSDLKAEYLYDEQSSLYCRYDHPCASIEDPDLLREQILRSNISCQNFENEIFDSDWAELAVKGASTATGHIESTAHLVLAGTHIGLMPNHYAQHWVEAGLIRSLAPQRFNISSRIHLVYLADSVLNQSCQIFVKYLKKHSKIVS